MGTRRIVTGLALGLSIAACGSSPPPGSSATTPHLKTSIETSMTYTEVPLEPEYHAWTGPEPPAEVAPEPDPGPEPEPLLDGSGSDPAAAKSKTQKKPGKKPKAEKPKPEKKHELSPEKKKKLLIEQKVSGTLAKNANSIRLCYDKAWAVDPTLEGKISLDFVIRPDGSVLSATASDDTIGDPGVSGCLVEVFLSLTFPPTGEDADVRYVYPLVFQPEL